LLEFDADAFRCCNWGEVGGDVARAAKMLRQLGVQLGDRVASLSENRSEWIVLDLALLVLGAVHVPIHATLSATQIVYQIAHSEATVLVLSGSAQAEKLTAHQAELECVLIFLSFESATQVEAFANKALCWHEQLESVPGE